MQRLIATAAAIALTTGCASQQAVPAVLDPEQLLNSQPETTQALTTAATELLNGRRITLGMSAFVDHSRLPLERARRNTPKGRLAGGRILQVPEELHLVRIGRRCELVHAKTNRRAALPGVKCIAEPNLSPN